MLDSVPDELIESWREALIRKAAVRLLETIEDGYAIYIDQDLAEAFVRCTLGAYDDILQDKKK